MRLFCGEWASLSRMKGLSRAQTVDRMTRNMLDVESEAVAAGVRVSSQGTAVFLAATGDHLSRNKASNRS